ncbi:Cu,Zn superoxide dismutase-like protein [Ceratobasidium sp. AG-I]|nr:Cu,Zn superoxide dismutase-like protein [Ceratobasidium sp. AG-I]
MFFSAAVLVLSTLSSVLATPHFEDGRPTHAKRTPKLYARAELINSKLGIEAHAEFVGTKDGKPTFVKIHVLSGLTTDPGLGGPFAYHIHTNPIPADGNCTKALAHLDPLHVTEGLVCDPAFPQYCQTGDLSGKHGKLNGTTDGEIATFGYSDAYVRFFPQSHSLLGRSIVIHSANKTRLACGNITSYLDGTADVSFEPTQKPSKYVKSYATAAPIQPTPPVIPFNGTEMTDPAVIAALPYPLPVPALSLKEALNIKLENVTHSVKFNNSEQTITQPKETKIDGTGPFKGWWDTTW